MTMKIGNLFGILFLTLSAVVLCAPAPAHAVNSYDARHCELYVDDLAIRINGIYGSSESQFVVTLITRPGDDVVAVGAYYRYDEKSQKGSWDARGRLVPGQEKHEIRGDFVTAIRAATNRYSVALLRSWNHYEQDKGERALLNFAFYVDLRDGQEIKRLWLKNGGQDFGPADVDSKNYYYSGSVFEGGYTSASYLWRDSGSPVFNARNSCL